MDGWDYGTSARGEMGGATILTSLSDCSNFSSSVSKESAFFSFFLSWSLAVLIAVAPPRAIGWLTVMRL